MKVELKPGTYVLAVSGGVDSVVLLDLLVNSFGDAKGYHFVVAHFDHGIREQSHKDAEFVRHLSEKYKTSFVYDRAALGAEASEDQARQARYEFLDSVKKATAAKAIITAHHRDDLLETAIFNVLRGTRHKGVVSLGSNHAIIRPLLGYEKSQILEYAKSKKLSWVEDETNQDVHYRRNYIRHKIIPRLGVSGREQLLSIIAKLTDINQRIDTAVGAILSHIGDSGHLNRHAFIMLPHKVALEVMAGWLRLNKIRDFDEQTLERLVRDAKTLGVNKQTNVRGECKLQIVKNDIKLIGQPR